MKTGVFCFFVFLFFSCYHCGKKNSKRMGNNFKLKKKKTLLSLLVEKLSLWGQMSVSSQPRIVGPENTNSREIIHQKWWWVENASFISCLPYLCFLSIWNTAPLNCHWFRLCTATWKIAHHSKWHYLLCGISGFLLTIIKDWQFWVVKSWCIP